jgi:hypothetical protein
MKKKRPETSMNTDERPEDYDEGAGDKYLDVENYYEYGGTIDADKWLNVRGDCTAIPSVNLLFDTCEYEIEYLDVEIIMNMGTIDADEWLNVRGDCTAIPSLNLLFDTREYEIEFTDRTGNQFLHLQEATDHKRDNSTVLRSEGMGHGAK